jgi:hypothetical protein
VGSNAISGPSASQASGVYPYFNVKHDRDVYEHGLCGIATSQDRRTWAGLFHAAYHDPSLAQSEK